MARPPILFIHGMWSHSGVWDWFRSHFEALGHETHAPMLPFHDPHPDAEPDPLLATTGLRDYVDALLAAARDLPEAPIIVGHSMGGLLAQKVAAENGAAALALLSPAPSAQAGSLAISPLRTMLGVTTSSNWWRSPTKIDADRARWGIFNNVPAEPTNEALRQLSWDSGKVLFQIAMPFADRSKASQVDYGALTMPSLVLVGDTDRTTPVGVARATARRIPGATDYVELDEVGHWIFHSPVRERVAEEIERLIKRA